MTESRCEPPAELRGVDGLHVIQPSGEDTIYAEWRSDQNVWRIVGGNLEWEPNDLGMAQYTYIAPVPDPAAVAALVTAARELDRLALIISSAVRFAGAVHSTQLDETQAAIFALRPALAAFPQPKDT